MSARLAEGGHHRTGSLPRRRTGQRPLLLRERRHSLPALAPQHLQGDPRRHGGADSRQRQPRPLGRAGRAAAQLGADRPCPLRRLARRQGLGDLHRRRGSRHCRPQGRDRLHALGQLRPEKRRHGRPVAQLDPEERPPLAALRLKRLLRLPPLLESQRIPRRPRQNPDRMVTKHSRP